jgi:signal transduction histidine kinase
MVRRPGWFSRLLLRLRLVRQNASPSRSGASPLIAGSVQTTPQETTLPVSQRLARGELQDTLNSIVYDVVEALGYVVGMVATYEEGDALPVRAYYVDPRVATAEQIARWEDMVSRFTPSTIRLSDPGISRTYIYDDAYANNLSYQAAHSGHPVESTELYSLFTPIAPPASKPVAELIQRIIGVQAVIAVPFFLETVVSGKPEREMVGNLFAAKRTPFTDEDRRVLAALARQAAAAILSERRRVQIELVQGLVYNIQRSVQHEAELLAHIVQGVVHDLGYRLALLATYGPDGTLRLRSFHIDPALNQRTWQEAFTHMQELPFAFPAEGSTNNLMLRAIQSEQVQFSQRLADAFVPGAAEHVVATLDSLQQQLGIQQIAVVPFSLTPHSDDRLAGRVIGTLCAVTRSRKFSSGEIALLQAFAQQAAAGLSNAQLYRQAEDRRKAAQLLAKMAFGASTAIHALKNHIGAIRLPLQLINMAVKQPSMFPDEKREELLSKLEKGSDLFRHLDEAATLLDHLHEPWRRNQEAPCDVNQCVARAIQKAIPTPENWLTINLAPDLPPVYTAREMLVEAVHVLLKNAVEAINAKEEPHEVLVTTRLSEQDLIEIVISDNGIGIKPEDVSQIFDMGWTTKPNGLGFGLFWTRDFLENMGGALNVQSRWQHGSTFVISLPSIPERPVSLVEQTAEIV